MLIHIFGGIVELILDVGEIAALATHPVRIALGADAEDDKLGLDLLAIGQGEREGALPADNLPDLGIEAVMSERSSSWLGVAITCLPF
jgi:hypothetical protein